MAEQLQRALRILRRKQVEQRVGLSRSSIYALMSRGEFPKQVQLSKSGGAVGWNESAIDEWIATRKTAGVQ